MFSSEDFRNFLDLVREWWNSRAHYDAINRTATPESKQSSVEIAGTFNGVKITAKSFAVTVGEAGSTAQAEVIRLAGGSLKADGKPAKVSE